MRKKDKTYNDIIKQDIIDNLSEENRILNNRITSLENQLETAYGVNGGLLESRKNEEDYQNLVKLNTLLMTIMGLTQNFCNDGSDLGKSIGKAIENFYADTALSLVKKVDFKLRARDNDEEEFDDDEGGEEEF